jgi:Ca2+-binding RTX toxin-like protein
VLAALSATAILLVAPPTDAAVGALGEGAGAADRQQLVYELNLARWNPVAYEARAGIAWERPAARPPLTLDDHLLTSAQAKADEMAAAGYFAHRSEATGEWPNDLVRRAGYPLDTAFGAEANNVESLHSGSPVAFDVLTSFAKSPTHMRHLFGQSWFSNHIDIGVGRSTTSNYWAVHTAFGRSGGPAVTGVVFDDADGDHRMDPGEGLAGVRVAVGPTTVFTNAGGGFAVEVEPGEHLVTAFGGAFGGVTTTLVAVDTTNVGVDFVSGDPVPIVRAYELCDGLEPTILGTSSDDVLVGTPGDDVIHGLGGFDLIDGRGGNDTICRDTRQPGAPSRADVRRPT